MNEWTLNTPIVDLPVNPDPQPHAAASRRARPKWLTGLGLTAAACAIIAGTFLVYAGLIKWHWTYAVLPTLLFSAFTVVVYILIAAIAWKYGRLS